MRSTRLVTLLLLVIACKQPATQKAQIPEVSVTSGGAAGAAVVVMTQAIAIKETGPKETVAAFGEVYAFSPETIVVRRDQPTLITFWNLQGDDEHDFMLLSPRNAVLTQFKLPPLKKTSLVFTFRREGLYPFVCTMHRPEMSGQILVVPPAR